MNKIYPVMMMLLGLVKADFDSTISYQVMVTDNAMWGVGNSQAINNNQGKKGLIVGKATSLGICPSLAYGVKPWTPGATIPYSYTSTQTQQVIKDQQKAQSSYQQCALGTVPSGNKIDMASVFEQAHDFVNNIDTIINTLTNLFPDITQGEGYESTTLLNFCTFSISLIERINTINQQLFAWAQFENYFENNVFTLFLDLQSLTPTQDDSTAGNAFASALINHYCALLKSTQSLSTPASTSNVTLLQQETAIKDALLW